MNDLIRRVEEASMNAWPATHQLLLDGWLIRLSNGFTKRANCVVPLYDDHSRDQNLGQKQSPGQTPANLATSLAIDLEKIRYCENLFAREQLQTVFRVTSDPRNELLDTRLDARGYRRVDETQVQLLDLQEAACLQMDAESAAEPADEPIGSPAQPQRQNPALEPRMRLVPIPHWLRIYAELAEMPDTAGELHSSLVRSIRPDCAFALLEIGDQPVGCALGVLEHDLIGLFDVITARPHRSKGYADLLLRRLLQWGANKGAKKAYLQVIANNAAALKLYDRLGFNHRYSYWYRQSN